MLTRILVPSDFGPAADVALGYARQLAGRFGADVVMAEPTPSDSGRFADARARRRRGTAAVAC